MPLELRLVFSDPTHVAVSLLGSNPDFSQPAQFISPLTEDDLKEIGWYVEKYATTYAAEPDDERAGAVRDKLPVWGATLFAAVFDSDRKAAKLFDRFLDTAEEGRVLSIAADHPAVLALPWELLATPGGSYLFNENPLISIRRGLPSAGQGRSPQPRAAKSVLHLLFILSRPDGAGFINPRGDAEAVLDALKEQKQARVEVEFLWPATLEALRQRLRDSRLPKIDIIHFDGHGTFASESSLSAAGKGEFTKEGGAAADKQQGWLLFEDEEGGKDLVSAQDFGELLFRNQAGLVVLSACKSAKMSSEDAMSGTAARLVHAGIPAVIAMSHSVLVTTAEQLFAEFYRHLFQGRSVASSLDEARHRLCFNPKRGTRLRGAGGAEEFKLELHDWFLPTLYQSGNDMALLSATDADSLLPKAEPLSNLPKPQESGFFGRSKELWQIERAFAVEKCRRYSITGFGGQGKTALALEAGRWLLRTKLFERACFVSYAAYQGSDPVSMAVSTMSAALQESLVDAAAAEAALKRVPTLLILDNLESLADGRGLHELLDAAALWSEAGASRVLLTSRQPDFAHPSYPLAGSYSHRHWPLQGLREDDAVAWFDELRSLPPKSRLKRPRRDVLISLFKQVGFHPLSISLLAQQLKERGPADVGERLEALLALQPLNREDRSLLASLELSIERLPEQCRAWLPRLGVFAGGGLEAVVQDVIGLKEYPSEWSILRYHLMLSGLMQAERVAENIWLRFHPTLAPALWEKLSAEEQARLLERHWQAYYQLSDQIYNLHTTNPHVAMAVAQVELSNLLRAVYAALQTGSIEKGVDFADKVNLFLDFLGFRRDYQKLAEAAAKAGGAVGSQAWYLSRSNLGAQLWQSGQTAAAAAVFQDILKGLGATPGYNRCLILSRLGLCCVDQGQPAQAERLYRQEILELAQLEQDKDMRRQTGTAWTSLADVLTNQGRYTEAKAAYQAALKIDEELSDMRGMAVDNGELGTLAQRQGELAEAAERHKAAIALFRSIKEPASEAVGWHQLGRVHQEAKHWEAAEQAYREAAQLFENLGGEYGRIKAGVSWHQLAQVCKATGRVVEAEQWYNKYLAVCRAAADRPSMALTLTNLASLLADTPARLDEARRLAEESLSIKETLDPAAAELWKTYHILAQLSTQQGESSQAAAYRAKSRQAYLAFPGWRQQVQRHEPLIAAVVQSGDAEAALAPYGEVWANLKAAIQRILSGERDEAALCGPLNYEEAAIIRAILEGIAGKG
jgi:tetratricopeptide (TPR) repeat protein